MKDMAGRVAVCLAILALVSGCAAGASDDAPRTIVYSPSAGPASPGFAYFDVVDSVGRAPSSDHASSEMERTLATEGWVRVGGTPFDPEFGNGPQSWFERGEARTYMSFARDAGTLTMLRVECPPSTSELCFLPPEARIHTTGGVDLARRTCMDCPRSY